jgi:hypothetical protein
VKFLLRVGAPALALIALAGACADTEAPAVTDERPEGGTLPPGADASPDPDAGTGDADAAPARECSDDGFCHTSLPKNQMLRAVWGDGSGTVWTVSEQGSVLRWDGSQWNVQATRLGLLTTAWGSSPTDVWVGGQDGLFHGTGANPAALTFARVTDLTGEVISIWGQSATDIWAVVVDVEGSRVVHYGDVEGALAWSVVPIGAPDSRFSRVWGSAGTGVWIASMSFDETTFSDRGEVHQRRPGSQDFEPVPMPGHPFHDGPYWAFGEVTCAAVASDTQMVIQARAVSYDPLFIRGTSEDGGPSFAFAAEVDNLSGEFNDSQDPETNAVLAFSHDDVWTAGLHGRIRHWDGTSWTRMAVTKTKYPLAADFYGLWAKNSNDIWAVGDNVALHLDPTKKR